MFISAGRKIQGLTLALCGLLAACVPAPPPGSYRTPQSLDDRIWSVAGERFVTPDTLLQAMTEARFVLLGEVHDNPRHHALEAWAMRALVEKNRRFALVAEMISTDQDKALKLFSETPRDNAATLRLFLDWDNSGWPDWAAYEPIFTAAVRGGVPIMAGNLDRTLLPALHRSGSAAFDDKTRADLALPAALPEAVGPALRDAIQSSHCGALPERVVQAFAEIQFARDAEMTRALMSTPDNALLIAEAEHVRKDRAVPYQLHRLGAHGRVLSIAFMETRPGQSSPTDYDIAAYDYVWFTPAIPRNDPCKPAG
ncbi:ChaN family lipoprotein [Govanella unica]|uniref:ChaN family lipoprotein n=1 Tax=Govanella unica TaxID=2975056 RepID=A0A9X3U0A8_9PROT|nr:ChaN family lipoprotein [Govania unica]MDA5194559.1 ChaN family lipoprotein [Govania unica]